MPFIPDEERIIIFDLPTAAGPFMRVDELKRLKDIGVGTLLLTSMDWNKFEPKLGRYDYRCLDEVKKRLELSGMRGLLPLWEKCNTTFPRDWYSQNSAGSIPLDHGKPEYILSPWSEPGQAHALEVMKLVKDYCQSDTCQVISSICRFGESVMPYDPRFYDPSALASWTATGSKHIKPVAVLPECAEWMRTAYRKLIKGHQAVLTDSPWREAWFMLHIPKQGRPVNGVDWIDDYFTDLPEGVTINHITFTYFKRVPQKSPEPFHAIIERLKREYNYKAWIGAEFCNGLREGTAIKARELGMRGLILGPCHPFTGKNSIEPWMYKEIEKAARWPI